MSSTPKIYHYDSYRCYTETTDASPDPLEPGRYLIPANATDTAPPEIPENHAAQWNGEAWEIVEDWRGTMVYSTNGNDGDRMMHEPGAIPDGYTKDAPPDGLHTWHAETQTWQPDPEKQAAAIEAARERVWEQIKNKRHDNLRGGVFVKSIKKWFHTNDESRAQYTFMRTLPQLPDGLQWKTMDNSFITLTAALLDELSLTMLQNEQHDFAVAEQHRAKLWQSKTPESYNYAKGWTKTYEESSK